MYVEASPNALKLLSAFSPTKVHLSTSATLTGVYSGPVELRRAVAMRAEKVVGGLRSTPMGSVGRTLRLNEGLGRKQSTPVHNFTKLEGTYFSPPFVSIM